MKHALPVVLVVSAAALCKPAVAAQGQPASLMNDMQVIAQSLGVGCEYCHVASRGSGRPEPKKDIARAMIAMTRELNAKVQAATGKPEAETTRVRCVTCHRGVTIPKPLSEIVAQTVREKGGAAAVSQYRELRDRYYGSAAYDFSDDELVTVAQRLAATRPDDAIALLQMNIEFHPRSARSYVALAYAHTRQLNDAAAIVDLEHALEIEPENGAVRGQLEQLKSYQRRRRLGWRVANPAVVNLVTVDVGRVLDDGRWGGYQKRLVSLTALAIILDGVDLQLFGIAVPAIMRDWQVTRADLAPILELGYVGMILGGSVGGILGDRLGRRVAIIASMITFAVMTAAIGATNGVVALGMVRLLAGVGLGGALPNAAALASEYVPLRHRPFAVTLTIVCVPLGGTLAGLAAIPVLPTLGWRGLFVLGGLMPMVMTIGMAPFLAESPRFLARHPRRWPELAGILRRIGHNIAPNAAFTDSRDTSSSRASFATLLGPEFRHDTIAVSLAFLASLLAVYTGFSWIPAMLTAAGLGATVASAGITLFNLGGVVGAVLGALVITRLGSRTTMLIMAAGAVVTAVAMSALSLTTGASPVPVLIMLTVLGGLINAVQTTLYALAAHVYPTSIRATGVGTVVGVGRLGALLSPYTGAWALDAGGPPAFFGVFAVAMTAAFAALAAVRRNIAPARSS